MHAISTYARYAAEMIERTRNRKALEDLWASQDELAATLVEQGYQPDLDSALKEIGGVPLASLAGDIRW